MSHAPFPCHFSRDSYLNASRGTGRNEITQRATERKARWMGGLGANAAPAGDGGKMSSVGTEILLREQPGWAVPVSWGLLVGTAVPWLDLPCSRSSRCVQGEPLEGELLLHSRIWSHPRKLMSCPFRPAGQKKEKGQGPCSLTQKDQVFRIGAVAGFFQVFGYILSLPTGEKKKSFCFYSDMFILAG